MTDAITDDFMNQMLATSKEYTVMLLRSGPNSESPDRDSDRVGARATQLHAPSCGAPGDRVPHHRRQRVVWRGHLRRLSRRRRTHHGGGSRRPGGRVPLKRSIPFAASRVTACADRRRRPAWSMQQGWPGISRNTLSSPRCVGEAEALHAVRPCRSERMTVGFTAPFRAFGVRP